jgi:hypothetical protein
MIIQQAASSLNSFDPDFHIEITLDGEFLIIYKGEKLSMEEFLEKVKGESEGTFKKRKEQKSSMSEERVQYTQWLKRANDTFLPTDNAKTKKQLDGGVYNIRHSQNVGWYLLKKNMALDELVDLPFPEAREVIKGIEKFWDSEEIFKKYKYAYKRGILLYGVPGGGKTSIIALLCNKLIQEKGGVVFYLSSANDLDNYATFMPEIYRSIEPTRPIITVIEDIDGFCVNKEVETKLINVLDGLEQIENVVYLATTNYTERLSDRIVNRPNRFDMRLEIQSPNAECRRI